MTRRALLFLCSSGKHTGPGAVALHHARLLREAGHPVHFCCRHGGTLRKAAENANVWQPHALHLPRRGYPWAVLGDILKIRRLAKRLEIGCVFAYRSGEHFAAGCALGTSVPLVRFVHSHEKYERAGRVLRGFFRWLLRRRFTKTVLTPDLHGLGWLAQARDPAFAHNPAETGEAQRARIAERGVEWVPGGVDTLHFTPDRGNNSVRLELGLTDKDVVVGFVARMKWGRGHYRFIDAFAQAAIEAPQLKALLIGEGEEKPKIVETARELGIGERLAIFDPGGRFDDALAAADIGFLYDPGSAGTARAALEMMSMARPMVLGNRGILTNIKRDLLEHLNRTAHTEDASPPETLLRYATAEGATFAESEEDAQTGWAKEMALLAHEPDLRLILGQAGRELMERQYSRRVLQNRLTDLVDRLSG